MVGALGTFVEGRHVLTHPVVWLGALTAVALSIFALVEEAPVLNRVSVTLGYTVFPIAVAVALVAGWAVLRTRGRTDDHPPAAMPVPMGQRVGGIVLGLLFPAVATFALAVGRPRLDDDPRPGHINRVGRALGGTGIRRSSPGRSPRP